MFIATGAMVSKGARMSQASSIALGGAVQIRLPSASRCQAADRMGAVCNPAKPHPLGEEAEILAGLQRQGLSRRWPLATGLLLAFAPAGSSPAGAGALRRAHVD